MEYLSKSYRLDNEVIAWLERLKELHGSVNKGLRLVAFGRNGKGERVQMTPGEEIVSDRESEPKELTYEREE